MSVRFCRTNCADQGIYNMNKYTKLIFVTCLSAPLFGIAETTLFEHNFKGGSSTDLYGQEVTSHDAASYTSTPTWQNNSTSSSFRADGSVVNDLADTKSGIWLPVTILQGNVYTLSADVKLTSTGNNWISLGYAQSNPDNAFFGSGGYGTAIVKPSQVLTYTGSNMSGLQTTFTVAGNVVHELKIVLDASDVNSSSWTMELSVNNESAGIPASASGDYAAIKYIGFTENGNATGEIDNLKFEVQTVPEPSQSGLIVMIVVSLVLCSRSRCLGASKVG